MHTEFAHSGTPSYFRFSTTQTVWKSLLSRCGLDQIPRAVHVEFLAPLVGTQTEANVTVLYAA